MHRKAGHTTYACPRARPAGRRVRGHRPCTQIPGSHSPRPEGRGMLSSSLSHLAGASCLSGLPPVSPGGSPRLSPHHPARIFLSPCAGLWSSRCHLTSQQGGATAPTPSAKSGPARRNHRRFALRTRELTHGGFSPHGKRSNSSVHVAVHFLTIPPGRRGRTGWHGHSLPSLSLPPLGSERWPEGAPSSPCVGWPARHVHMQAADARGRLRARRAGRGRTRRSSPRRTVATGAPGSGGVPSRWCPGRHQVGA